MRESEFGRESYGRPKLNLSISHEDWKNFAIGCVKILQPMRNFSHTIPNFAGSAKL